MNPPRVSVLRGRRVALQVASMGTVLMVALGACSGDDGSAPSSTSTASSTTTTIVDPAELPDVDAAAANADLEYLDGGGAALLSMVDAVERATVSGAALDDAACTSLFDQLTAAGSPEELAALIRPIVDEVSRSSLEATRSAAVSLVATCQSGDVHTPASSGPEDAVAQGGRAAGLFRQRVSQMEEGG